MRSIRVTNLVGIAVVVGAVSWVILDAMQRNGSDPLPVPWTAPAGLLVLVGLVLGAAREVSRWVRGRRARPMNPLTAARIAVLASAAGTVGAVLTGWYAAQAVVVLRALVGERRGLFWTAAAAAVCAVLLAAAGLLGQQWCRRPPDGDDHEDELPR